MTLVINLGFAVHVFCRKRNMEKYFQYNLSFTDISIRYALIMALGIAFGFTLFYPFIVLAVIIFMTAVTGICPIYNMLGINHAAEREV